MRSIPFLHPDQLRSNNLPLPDRSHTPEVLLPWSIQSTSMQLDAHAAAAIEGYRALYALDQLSAHHRQGYIHSGSYRIHVQTFQPLNQHQQVSPARGTVWLLHGYLEHSAIYQPVIGELLSQDFNVVTFDLPGHGLSQGEEAGVADFADYQQILQDVVQQVRQSAQFDGIQLGVGQSTGAAILMHHVLAAASMRQEPLVSRLLLLSPLVRPARAGWWQNSLGLNVLRRVTQRVPRKFRRNNHNPEFLRFVRLQDPLQVRYMAISWILAMTRWEKLMHELPPCRIPVWVVQGTLDQTVDWRYNLAYIRRMFRLQTCLLLEEGSHQLINERADIRAALTGLIPAFLQVQGPARFFD